MSHRSTGYCCYTSSSDVSARDKMTLQDARKSPGELPEKEAALAVHISKTYVSTVEGSMNC